MPQLIILGSSNAIATPDHDNTHMVLVGEQHTVLIDCASNPILRLRRAGLDPLSVTDLILTHFHPDHVSGVGIFLLDSWLLGRKNPLIVYGLESVIEKTRQMMALFEWHSWPNFFPVNFQIVESATRATVLEGDEFRIFASPVEHLIPNIGLRMEFLRSGRVLAYSCDTMPTPAVIDLADQAEVLIHESTGEFLGHTSAAQAGEIARRAGAQKLFLIHYDTWNANPETLLVDVRKKYAGPVELAVDLMKIDL